ncbi:MAG: proline--tRNA ligase, partial [Thermoleophilum sp.]|nr:proline--tRNA ligase [Thermoleophilum sp.]
MARLSSFFLPTLREDPADAESVSHRLVVRAGLARQLGAGLWTSLPALWRAHRRCEQIIREEMDAIGAQEMLMPLIQPIELWQRTGRAQIEELFKLRDRREAELVLAMTHEEAVTWHVAREVRSYRQLPLILYQFQLKARDEPRPRAGLLRVREFVMKDAYSFDRDAEGLERSYELHRGAYARIFDRAGLEWYEVESDVGMMGGSGAHEYMAPCPAGENEIALSDAGYAANVEIARGTPRAPGDLPAPRERPEKVHTPGQRTIEEVSAFLAVPPAALVKALPVRTESGRVLVALVRGDHRLNEVKLRNHLGEQVRQLTAEEIEWKVIAAKNGSTTIAPYIDARAVMTRLDRAFGAFGWSVRYTPAQVGSEHGVVAGIAIRNPETGEWVEKQDGSGASDMEPFKGGISGALKRAATAWGIGRELYTYPRVIVEGEHRYIPFKVLD